MRCVHHHWVRRRGHVLARGKPLIGRIEGGWYCALLRHRAVAQIPAVRPQLPAAEIARSGQLLFARRRQRHHSWDLLRSGSSPKKLLEAEVLRFLLTPDRVVLFLKKVNAGPSLVLLLRDHLALVVGRPSDCPAGFRD